MSEALANMILGGLTPQEALLRNRRELMARIRGDVVAEVVTQRSARGYFLSVEDEAAARASAGPETQPAFLDTAPAAAQPQAEAQPAKPASH